MIVRAFLSVLATNFIRAATANQPVRKYDHMWKRPPQGFVKVNVDATFDHDTQSGATGAVARDDKRNFLAATNWFLSHVNNVDCAELSAICNGLYLAAKVAGNRVIVESDSTVVVQTLKQHEDYFGPEVATVRNAITLLMILGKFRMIIVFVKQMR